MHRRLLRQSALVRHLAGHRATRACSSAERSSLDQVWVAANQCEDGKPQLKPPKQCGAEQGSSLRCCPLFARSRKQQDMDVFLQLYPKNKLVKRINSIWVRGLHVGTTKYCRGLHVHPLQLHLDNETAG